MQAQLPLPEPLPNTSAKLLAQRKSKKKLSIVDQVDALHTELYDIDDYRRYFYAISNAQAVEGSIVADLVMAAQRVRNLAKEKNSPIHKEKLWDIAQALTTVMRRYNESRKDRKARALTAGNGHEGGEA